VAAFPAGVDAALFAKFQEWHAQQQQQAQQPQYHYAHSPQSSHYPSRHDNHLSTPSPHHHAHDHHHATSASAHRPYQSFSPRGAHGPDTDKREWVPFYERHHNANISPRPNNEIIFEGPGAEPIIPRALRLFTISSASNVKSVAGSIAHTSRRGGPPVLLVDGEGPVNQCIKGLAIARTYLAQDEVPSIDLQAQVELRQGGGIHCMLFKVPLADPQPRSVPCLEGAEAKDPRQSEPKRASGGMQATSDEGHDLTPYLKVAQNSDDKVVAGAIAKKTRRGEEVDLLAIGGAAVNVAVRALYYARLFLKDDNISLCFTPSFLHLKMEGEARSGIRLMVVPRMVVPLHPKPTKGGGKKEGEKDKEETTHEAKNEKADTAAAAEDVSVQHQPGLEAGGGGAGETRGEERARDEGEVEMVDEDEEEEEEEDTRYTRRGRFARSRSRSPSND
jgi:stage V sporulation protein S